MLLHGYWSVARWLSSGSLAFNARNTNTSLFQSRQRQNGPLEHLVKQSKSIWNPLPPHLSDVGLGGLTDWRPLHPVICQLHRGERGTRTLTCLSSSLCSFYNKTVSVSFQENHQGQHYKSLPEETVWKCALLSPYLNNIKSPPLYDSWLFTYLLCDFGRTTCGTN